MSLRAGFVSHFSRLALATVAGIAFALAFPRTNVAPLAWIAPAFWLFLLRGLPPGKALLSGLAFGAGFFGLLLCWVHGVLGHYTSLPLFLTVPIWSLLIAYLALFIGIFAWMLAGLERRLGRAAWWLAPALWLGCEFFRARILGGFPWGDAGTSHAGGLALVQAASFSGIGTVSFLLASAWTALVVLAGMFRNASRGLAGRRLETIASVAVLAGVGAVILLGALRLRSHPPETAQELFRGALPDGWIATGEAAPAPGSGAPRAAIPPERRTGRFRIALVQGGFGSDFEALSGDRILATYLDLSRLAARARPDLIVWPETNAPYQVEEDPLYRRTLQDLSGALGSPLLLGSVGGSDSAGYTNSAWLVGPEGIRDRYDKQRLVQYGETVPLKRWLPFVRKFVPQAGDFRAGTEPGLMRVGERSIGVTICYEMIFADLSRALAKRGARLLVNMTNDSWFENAGPWQHADFARLRAIESGLWVARVASTGRTVLVDPYGRERASGGVGGPAILIADIPNSSAATTFFVIGGEWLSGACAILTVTALAFLIVGNNIDRWRPR